MTPQWPPPLAALEQHEVVAARLTDLESYPGPRDTLIYAALLAEMVRAALAHRGT